MNEELIKYINERILPKYVDDSGHSLAHIKYVIDRSLKFAEQVPEVDKNICYVAAAYHDLGRLIDDDTHEKISAAFVRADDNLKRFFFEEEIETIAEAVEDHRASSKHEPRSIYGRIVSSADRSTSTESIIKRAVEARYYRGSEKNLDKSIEDARQHVLKKYGKNGYALKKMYFDDPDFMKVFEEINEVAGSFEKFKEKYLDITHQTTP